MDEWVSYSFTFFYVASCPAGNQVRPLCDITNVSRLPLTARLKADFLEQPEKQEFLQRQITDVLLLEPLEDEFHKKVISHGTAETFQIVSAVQAVAKGYIQALHILLFQ